MNTYMITLAGYDRSATAYGETPGKAKYNFYLEMGDLFDSFAEFLQFVKSIRLIHKFRPCDLFGNDGGYEFNSEILLEYDLKFCLNFGKKIKNY